MGLNILAEAVLRIEHKLDLLLAHLKVKGQSMQFFDNRCSVCQQPIQYLIDMSHNVVKRKCGCSTGKQPSILDLTPQGAPNGNEAGNSSTTREDRSTSTDDGAGRRNRRSR